MKVNLQNCVKCDKSLPEIMLRDGNCLDCRQPKKNKQDKISKIEQNNSVKKPRAPISSTKVNILRTINMVFIVLEVICATILLIIGIKSSSILLCAGGGCIYVIAIFNWALVAVICEISDDVREVRFNNL